MVRTNFAQAGMCAVAAAMMLAACGNPAPSKDDAADSAMADAGAPAAQIQAAELGPPATPDVQAKYQGEFEAAGDEPAWKMDLLNDYVSFTRPGLGDVGGLPSPREFRANGARIVAGPLTVVLKAEACTPDGGSALPYKAIVQFEGVSYEGCARRSSSTEASNDNDWTGEIGRVMGAIDSCIAKSDKKPARVTIAYMLDGGIANVRILDAEGGRYECSAPATGGAVTGWEPIADQSNLSGERDPMFTRAPTAAPAGKCYASTAAKSSSGAQIGWYTRRIC